MNIITRLAGRSAPEIVLADEGLLRQNRYFPPKMQYRLFCCQPSMHFLYFEQHGYWKKAHNVDKEGKTIPGAIRMRLWYDEHKGENMLSETQLNAQKKIDGASAQLRQIEEAKYKVAKERTRAEERLQNLKEKLPRLLARRALEQATDGEIYAIKRDIMDLEVLLAEFPLTLQGLDELERPIRNGMLDLHKGGETVLIATSEAV